jgi:hypothetical protein
VVVGLVAGLEGDAGGGAVGLVAGLEDDDGAVVVVGPVVGLVGAPAGLIVSVSVFDEMESTKSELGSLNSAPMLYVPTPSDVELEQEVGSLAWPLRVIEQMPYPFPLNITVPCTIAGIPTSANVTLSPAVVAADEELLTVIVNCVVGGFTPSA